LQITYQRLHGVKVSRTYDENLHAVLFLGPDLPGTHAPRTWVSTVDDANPCSRLASCKRLHAGGISKMPPVALNRAEFLRGMALVLESMHSMEQHQNSDHREIAILGCITNGIYDSSAGEIRLWTILQAQQLRRPLSSIDCNSEDQHHSFSTLHDNGNGFWLESMAAISHHSITTSIVALERPRANIVAD
jgi:hypothetical protein